MVSAPALATLPVPAEVLRLQALARRETTPCGDGDMVWQTVVLVSVLLPQIKINLAWANASVSVPSVAPIV